MERLAFAMLFLFGLATGAAAQGVTTSGVAGVVKDQQGLAVPGVTVTAVHVPSGTTYTAVTQTDGRFTIPGMRVGGPYTVTAELSGFQPAKRENLSLALGVTADVDLTLSVAATSETVDVVATADPVFSSNRTGAATAVTRQNLETMPTHSGRLESFVRLTPQSSGGLSFGQDNRLNNITVDGSYFNNSFGLGGAPGDRTGVAPISVDSIEQVQVNIAPYDVRQGNFIGAGVNTVTRSGTNQFTGSAYYQMRNDSLVGKTSNGLDFDPGTFEYKNYGFTTGGRIIRNRAFYFANYEDEADTRPGTTWRANNGGETVGGQVTRVLASDLNALSSFLSSNFGYETGGYQGYDHETPAMRLLLKTDLNLSDRHRASLRYTHLDSDTDVLASNSSSLGFGNRRTNQNALNFRNSNYKILENIRSFIGQLNSVIGSSTSNTLIVGYTKQDESRDSLGTFFPMVDVLSCGSTYTTFGFEPFTPNNELRYNTFQLQNNVTMLKGRHTITVGGSFERYESENVFFPGSQSVYVYNSLQDFYTDAQGYLANPNRTTSPVTLRRFQVRWANIPGQEKPIQPLEVNYTSLYAQDEFRMRPDLTITAGVRMDVAAFGDTAFANANADGLTFRDADGSPITYSSGKLPDATPLWSPRVGFNWNVNGTGRTQVRGGTGVFTGKPAYVWISNQVGNTGVLTGFEQLDNTTVRPFNPDPDHYKPTTVTGDPAASYELALTASDFKFPQVWRSNVAVDQRLVGNWTGTVEFLYSKDINGISYHNANLVAPNATFVGADNRPRWVGSNRIHSHVANNIVLGNNNKGSAWNIAASLERSFANGFLFKAAYSYGETKNLVDAGSIAAGSWTGNPQSGDPNAPALGFSSSTLGHRVFGAATYTRDWLSFGGTTVSLFWEGVTRGVASYTFNGDMNGDSNSANDLIYIHRDTSEMNFQQFASGGVTYTADQQAQAWNAYIEQDPYLSKHRGEYAERGGLRLPMVFRMDFGLQQDIFADLGGRRHTLKFRFDVLNLNNLINDKWGIGQAAISTQPLTNPSVDSQGRSTYRLRVVNGQLMNTTFQKSAGIGDLWRMQFTLRYLFN
jgi:hypothetical protein